MESQSISDLILNDLISMWQSPFFWSASDWIPSEWFLVTIPGDSSPSKFMSSKSILGDWLPNESISRDSICSDSIPGDLIHYDSIPRDSWPYPSDWIISDLILNGWILNDLNSLLQNPYWGIESDWLPSESIPDDSCPSKFMSSESILGELIPNDSICSDLVPGDGDLIHGYSIPCDS